jgi:hypothetical protein
VNFFGHAAISTWYAADEKLGATALGAMLPDVAAMARVRLDRCHHPDIADGVALHHRTDSAFHVLPVVTSLMSELSLRLERARISRGPRRAVSHIGVELLLDGNLLQQPSFCAAYERALAFGLRGADLAFADAGDLNRLDQVLTRMRRHGPPMDLAQAAAITLRIARMIQHRPLLRATPTELEVIEHELEVFQPRVAALTDATLASLRAALDHPR